MEQDSRAGQSRRNKMFSNWKILGSVQVKYSRSPNWICKVTNLSSSAVVLAGNKSDDMMDKWDTGTVRSGGDRQTD